MHALHELPVIGSFGIQGNINQTFWLHHPPPPNLIGASGSRGSGMLQDSKSLNSNMFARSRTEGIFSILIVGGD